MTQTSREHQATEISETNVAEKLAEALGNNTELPQLLRLLTNSRKRTLESLDRLPEEKPFQISKDEFRTALSTAGCQAIEPAMEVFDWYLNSSSTGKVALLPFVSVIVGILGSYREMSFGKRTEALLREMCGLVVTEGRYSPHDILRICGGEFLAKCVEPHLSQVSSSTSVEDRLVTSLDLLRLSNPNLFHQMFPGLVVSSSSGASSDGDKDPESDEYPNSKTLATHDTGNDQQSSYNDNHDNKEALIVPTDSSNTLQTNHVGIVIRDTAESSDNKKHGITNPTAKRKTTFYAQVATCWMLVKIFGIISIVLLNVAIAAEISNMANLSQSIGLLVVASANIAVGVLVAGGIVLYNRYLGSDNNSVLQDDTTHSQEVTNFDTSDKLANPGSEGAFKLNSNRNSITSVQSARSNSKHSIQEMDRPEAMKQLIGQSNDKSNERIVHKGTVYLRHQAANDQHVWVNRWATLQANGLLSLQQIPLPPSRNQTEDTSQDSKQTSEQQFKKSQSTFPPLESDKEADQNQGNPKRDKVSVTVVSIEKLDPPIPETTVHPKLYCFKVVTESQGSLLLACENLLESMAWVLAGSESIQLTRQLSSDPNRVDTNQQPNQTHSLSATESYPPKTPLQGTSMHLSYWDSPYSENDPLPQPPTPRQQPVEEQMHKMDLKSSNEVNVHENESQQATTFEHSTQRTNGSRDNQQHQTHGTNATYPEGNRGSIGSNATFFQLSEYSDDDEHNRNLSELSLHHEISEGSEWETDGLEPLSVQTEKVNRTFDDLLAKLG